MGKIADSELIINTDGSVFHLHIRPEHLADKVILVGDPGRVDMVASFLTDVESSTSSREFRSVTGSYKGTRMTVLSTGIGCDNIDIVMTELDALANIDFRTREVLPEHRCLTILRIGTCGVIQPDIPLGSYIFSRVSAGFDGLLNWYGGRDEVVLKDVEEAFLAHTDWNRYLPTPYFVKAGDALTERFSDCTVPGMTISAPGFYGPQGRNIRLDLADNTINDRLKNFSYNNIKTTNYEMETSSLYALGKNLGHNVLTICTVIANREKGEFAEDYHPAINRLIETVLNRL